MAEQATAFFISEVIRMVMRLKLTLEQEEYSALLKLAISEERNPEGQLRYMLRSELFRLGLLIPVSNPISCQQETSHERLSVK